MVITPRWLLASLRSRLILLVLLAVLPTLALELYSGRVQRRQAAATQQANLLSLARFAAGRQEQLIERTRELLVILAELPEVRAAESDACSARLAALLSSSQGYANFGVAGLDGAVYCSGQPATGTINIADRSYFRRALQTRAFAAGGFQIGRITRKPTLNFGYPILMAGGEVQAVVFAALNLTWLNQVVATTTLPVEATLIVTDRDGLILARSPDPEAWAGRMLPDAPIVKAMLDQGEGLADLPDLDGVPTVFAFTPLSAGEEADAYLGISVPRAVVIAPVNRMVGRQLAALALVTVLALAGAWLASNVFILRPTNALVATAERLAHGDLSARTGFEKGQGELSRLAGTLDQMASSLQQREAQLRGAEVRYRALVEQTPAVTYIAALDQRRSLRYLSPQIEPLLGFTLVEWLADPDLWHARLHPNDHDRVQGEVAVSCASGQPLRTEYRLLARDGRQVWVLDQAAAVLDETEQAQVLQGTMLDITDRKSAEEARSAQDVADRASQTKSEFLSRMSHELRTPLNAILGFAQLLEMDTLTDEQRASVAHILKGGKHLLSLINEVLDISRIEAGRLSLSLEPVDAHELVRESVALVGPLVVQQRLRMKLDPPTLAAIYVLADQQRLKQVLVNLLANAVKYNRPGGRVTVAVTAASPERVRLAVSDTGAGIAPEHVARLFMPFDRLGAEASAVEGTGLGLTLSKGLIDAMGGQIGVESTVGAGSTFWVELPRASGVTEAEEPAQPAVAERATEEHGQARQTVLYIEDNLSNLQLVERILKRRQELTVLAAMQGRLGLELAREHHPDVILLDLHLPDLSGWEVLAALQADAVTRDIPVIVISADATPRQVERLLAAGARAYLTKPLDVRQFLTILDEQLQSKE